MTSWHLVFALSGQVADFSDATNTSLVFAPRYSCDKEASFALPVFLPGVVGVVSCTDQEYHLRLDSGHLEVHHLVVSGATYPISPVTLVAGQTVHWNQN
jgi:hypothetical protein